MNGPLNITPATLADEVARLQRKLAAGIRTLREVEDVDFGVTPREAVWSDGKTVLYRFRGQRAPTARVPILVSYALVNRPYMIDLQEDRSLVKGLLERGEDVYVIDWGYPDRSDRYLTLEDYIERFIGGAVDHLRKAHGLPAINLLGICQGCAFALCYAALHPQKIRNLITMVTPVDFHTPDNMLSNWNREIDVDLLVDILDNPRAVEDFLRMEKWIFDSPDQAGEAFREFSKQFFQENRFVTGAPRIGTKEVHLGDVDMPILNIYAEQDHLVPPDSSRALRDLAGSTDYTELAFKGGHIGIYVSGRAQREVPQTIHDWLQRRT